MGNFAQRTNGNFDTLAAAVPAPYGPITRVGSLPDQNPNSHIPIKCTSALGVTVYLSYDDLDQDFAQLDDILVTAHAGDDANAKAWQLFKGLQAVVELGLAAGDPPWTDAETHNALSAIGQLPGLMALWPEHPFIESEGWEERTATAAFTAVDNTDGTATITRVPTGQHTLVRWDINDGEVTGTEALETDLAITFTPAGGAGSYDIELTVVGGGRVSVLRDTVAITGP